MLFDRLHYNTFTLSSFQRFRPKNSSNCFIEHLVWNEEIILKKIVQILLHVQLTCLRPRCVNAEHSMYLTALILLAFFLWKKRLLKVRIGFSIQILPNFCPCSRFNANKPCSANALNVSRSSRKSILVPGWEKKHLIKKLVRVFFLLKNNAK